MKNLFNNQSGMMNMLIALALAGVIIGVFALSIDLNKMQGSSGKNQNAVDSAALAGAEYIARYKNLYSGAIPSSELYENFTKRVHRINFGAEGKNPDPVISQEVSYSNAILQLKACVVIDDKGTADTGDDSIGCNTAKATTGVAGKNVEIVFALDLSPSMLEDVNGKISGQSGYDKNKQKILSLTNSMTSIINDFNSSLDKPFVGIVPYRGMVDLGPHAANIVVNDFASITKPAQANRTKFAGADVKYMYGSTAATEGAFRSKLLQVPLTRRFNYNGSVSDFDNADAVPNTATKENMFLAYWHQPYKYMVRFQDLDTGSMKDLDNESASGATPISGRCKVGYVLQPSAAAPGNGWVYGWQYGPRTCDNQTYPFGISQEIGGTWMGRPFSIMSPKYEKGDTTTTQVRGGL